MTNATQSRLQQGNSRAQALDRHLAEIECPEECRDFLNALRASGEVTHDGFMFRVQQKLTKLENGNG